MPITKRVRVQKIKNKKQQQQRCRKTNKRHVLVTPNERNVSEAPYSIDGTVRQASNAFPSSAEVTNSTRIANSISTSPAFDQGTTEQVATIYDVRNGSYSTDCLQNRISCGGSRAFETKGFHSGTTGLHHPVLGAQDENNQSSPFSLGHNGSYRRGLHEPNISIPTLPFPQHSYFYPELNGNHSFLSAPSGQRILLPFHQTGGYSPVDGTCSRQTYHIGGGDAYREPPPAPFPATILGGERAHRASFRNAEHDKAPLKARFLTDLNLSWDTLDKDAQFSTRRVWSRPHRMMQPPTPDEMKLPLHAPSVPSLDIARIRSWMQPEMKCRFDEVWKLLTNPQCLETNVNLCSVKSSTLSQNDISKLLKSEIIRRVTYEELESHPTKAQIIPFTTFEERDSGARRRFICWPKSHNLALEHKYKADVPIGQPVSYVNRVRYERGMKRDLKAGFFQVELPAATRAYYRFCYGAATYEMTRMPMGHACAPEIQQILTATLAGHANYSAQTADSQGFRTDQLDVYLDGIRYCGSKIEVTAYERFVDERANMTHMTFKEEDTCNATKYDFLGVRYDHDKKCYNLSDRFIKKIPHEIASHAPLHAYESLCARLVYASAVLGVIMPRYYWAIKFIRRQISKLNKGMIREHDTVKLSYVVSVQLNRWIQEVKNNQPQLYSMAESSKFATLYTDASLDGWGAVLFLPDGTVYGTGAAWDKDIEINHGEALAIENALIAFAEHWNQVKFIRLRVDNTSVEAAMRKRWADSYNISDVLTRILSYLHLNHMLVFPEYVTTQENQADAWSRNRYDTWRDGGVHKLATGWVPPTPSREFF